MLESLRRRRQNRQIVDRLWDEVVSRARRPERFVEGGLPDTVFGRFESLSIEVFLLLRRCGADTSLAALSQDLVDRFMTDLDHSMRELGVGYLAVPKRMRKLAGRFYARVALYEPAVASRDVAALAKALRETAFVDAPGGDADRAEALATQILAADLEYRHMKAEVILAGSLDGEQQESSP